MDGAFLDDQIDALPLLPHFSVLELEDGLEELDFEWRLGMFSVYKDKPIVRMRYAFDLSDTACLRKVRSASSEPPLAAVILHLFDHASDPALSPEYLVGWVPLEREAELDQWLAFLNQHLQQLVC